MPDMLMANEHQAEKGKEQATWLMPRLQQHVTGFHGYKFKPVAFL